MNRAIRDLLVVAAGLTTSSATALIIWLSVYYLGFAIYSFSYWFIPVGAIGCGMAAGSGYYFAAKELHHQATKLVLASLLSMSVTTYFVVQYLQYYYMDVNGKPVREVLSFPAFLDIVIRHSTVGLIFGPQIGPLGIYGYVLVLLPIGGFAIGGFFLFSMLRPRAYCDACEIYLEPGLAGSRYALVQDEILQLFATLKKLYREANIRGAVAFFATWGLDIPPRGCTLTTDIVVCPCPNCGGQWVQFQGKEVIKEEYRAVGAWYVGGFSVTPIITVRSAPNSASAPGVQEPPARRVPLGKSETMGSTE